MKKGFTIIELLIVITVISILIGIALPRFRGMQEEGKIAQAKGELRTLQTAVESYYMHNNNNYPAASGDTWQTALTQAAPNIIGVALIDPFNGTTQYKYALDTNTVHKYYAIYSMGPVSSPAAGSCAGVSINNDTGAVTETSGGVNCIYVANGSTKDAQP